MAYCLEVVTEEDLWRLEGAWRELFRHASYPTPFACWEWATEWWRHFAACTAMNAPRLLTLTVYDSAETLIGIAPFYHTDGRDLSLRLQDLRLLGDLGGREESLTEEPILLLRAGREQEALTAILTHLRQHDTRNRYSGCWDYVNLRVAAWSDHEPPFAPLPATRLQRRQSIPLQTLALPDSWEALRGGLRKSMRDNLAYYPRLLHRRNHTFAVRIAHEGGEVAEAVDILTDLHRRRAACTRGVPHTNHLSGEVQRRFLARCLPLLAAQGMAAILLLEIDGELAAAQSVLENADTLILYYSGFDPRWYDYSPVTLLCTEAIRDAIARGLTTINFLTVQADYKSRWGAKPGRELHELVYLQPHPLSLLRALLHANSLHTRP